MSETRTFIIPLTAVEWLRTGERGLSACSIFERLTGLPVNGGRWGAKHHPHDPADLRRCRELLAAVPEFTAVIGEMADVSTKWAALIKRWDELGRLLDEEMAEKTGKAPRTYALMRELLDEKPGLMIRGPSDPP